MKGLILFISGLILGIILFAICNNNADYCTNNDTRDKIYERYVESTMLFNEADYDSIRHTQKYQQYVAEHGEWFNNYNY